MKKYTVNFVKKDSKQILFERMEKIGGFKKNTELNENVSLFLESFSQTMQEDWVNDPETGLKIWTEPDPEKTDRGVVDYDEETPEGQSGFCKFNPEISKWALSKSDNLAMILTFVIVSQQTDWGVLMAYYPDLIHYIYTQGGGESFPHWQQGATFARIVKNEKRRNAVDYVWKNKDGIYSQVVSILKPFSYEDKSKSSEAAAFELFYFFGTRIPMLGNVKAGFATQLVIGRSGCIDSINSRLFGGGMPKGADQSYQLKGHKPDKPKEGTLPETIRKHMHAYDDYLKSLNDQSSKVLWDKWTEIISNKLLFAPDKETGRKAKETFVKKGDEEISANLYNTQPDDYTQSQLKNKRSPVDISQQHHPEYVRDTMGISKDALKFNKKR